MAERVSVPPRRAGRVSALLLAVAAVAVTAWRAPTLPCGDPCTYYAAGQLAREGEPAAAFDPGEIDRHHRGVHDLGLRSGPFLYSPVWLLPSALLARMPFPEALGASRALGAFALAAGLFAVLLRLDTVARRVAVAVAFALSHTAWVQLVYGNWSTLLFAFAAFAMLAIAVRSSGPEARATLAGGAFAAALALLLKPFLLFGFVPAAAARRRFAIGMALLAVLVAGICLPVTGIESWRRYASFLLEKSDAGVTPYYSKSSLAANLARLESAPRDWVLAPDPVESLPVRAAFWLGLPLLAVGAVRLRAAPEAAFAFGLAWTLLFVPQIWEHTEVLLFVALPALGPRRQLALAGILAATVAYNLVQQRLLHAVLAGGAPGALRALLWLYPAIALFVQIAAWHRGTTASARSGDQPAPAAGIPANG